ncbi:MAG: hypothetical protein F4W96_10715 [Chloroflexi bacterium]|nr:hypothetical protein [Chloroflexota bacterium]
MANRHWRSWITICQPNSNCAQPRWKASSAQLTRKRLSCEPSAVSKAEAPK